MNEVIRIFTAFFSFLPYLIKTAIRKEENSVACHIFQLTSEARIEPPIQLLNRLSAELAAAIIFKRMLCKISVPFNKITPTNKPERYTTT